MMRWVLRAVVLLLALVTISVAVLVLFVPSTAIERHVLAAVARFTDTEITSGGSPEITLFPAITMKLRNLRMRPRGAAKPVLSAKEVDAEVGWLPLLTQWTVSLDKLHFADPVLELPGKGEEALERVDAPRGKPSYRSPSLAIGQVEVENGSVLGLAGGLRVKGVSANVKSVTMGKPLPVEFKMLLNGRPVAGAVTFKDPAQLGKGQPVDLSSRLSGDYGNAEFDGAAEFAGAAKFNGKAKIETSDLQSASQWLGLPAELGDTAKQASFAGKVNVAGGVIEIADAATQIDQVGFVLGAQIKTDEDLPSASNVTVANLDPSKLFELPSGVEVKNVAAKIDEVAFGAPVKSELEFDLNGEPVKGSATLAEIAQLTRPGPVRLNAAFEIPGGNLEFFGDFPSPAKGGPAAAAPAEDAQLESVKAPKAIQGILKLKTASARRTAAWLGVELPQGRGYNSLEFDGDVSIASNRVRLGQLKAKLDDTTASGDVTVDMSGERRVVSGKLNLDKLDSGLYLGADSKAGGGSDGTKVAQLESLAAGPYQLVLEPLKPSLEAYVAGAAGGPLKKEENLESLRPSGAVAWSGEDLGLGALKEGDTDLDLDLSVGELSHGNLNFGKTELAAKLAGGRLDLNVKEAEPLEGKISGTVKIDASGEVPALAVDLKAQGVRVEKVIRQAAQRDVIRGALSGEAKLAAHGNSQAALIGSLNGTAHGVVKNGVVVGYDVRRIVRPFANRSYNPNHTTPFDSLASDFEIAGGVSKNPNIALDGPAIVVRAEGEANLKTAEIDYRTKLSLVPPPSNFSLPLKILGTWRNIKAALDWARLATQWTGPLPFEGFESVRKPNLGDKELESLVQELIAKSGGKKGIPPQAAALLRELTGTGR